MRLLHKCKLFHSVPSNFNFFYYWIVDFFKLFSKLAKWKSSTILVARKRIFHIDNATYTFNMLRRVNPIRYMIIRIVFVAREYSICHWFWRSRVRYGPKKRHCLLLQRVKCDRSIFDVKYAFDTEAYVSLKSSRVSWKIHKNPRMKLISIVLNHNSKPLQFNWTNSFWYDFSHWYDRYANKLIVKTLLLLHVCVQRSYFLKYYINYAHDSSYIYILTNEISDIYQTSNSSNIPHPSKVLNHLKKCFKIIICCINPLTSADKSPIWTGRPNYTWKIFHHIRVSLSFCVNCAQNQKPLFSLKRFQTIEAWCIYVCHNNVDGFPFIVLNCNFEFHNVYGVLEYVLGGDKPKSFISMWFIWIASNKNTTTNW